MPITEQNNKKKLTDKEQIEILTQERDEYRKLYVESNSRILNLKWDLKVANEAIKNYQNQ